jgi:hypothetical protein
VSYTVYELRDSESGSIDQTNLEAAETWSIQKHYVIGQCPGGFYEVYSAIGAYAPRYVKNPYGRYWRRKKLGIKGLGKSVFDVVADYETLTPISGEDAANDDNADSNFVPGSIAWDTTGGTERMTQAISERVVGDTVDFQGAINVSGTSVQGIDVVVPTMRYSETWIMPLSIGLSSEYVGNVFTLTGKTNKAQFRAFAPGEALFMGGRAQWSGDQPYVPVTFEWQCRKDDDNYQLGGGLPATTKKGWEYVWIVYDDAVNNNTLVKKPRAYIFDTIYDSGDFSLLKIVQRSPGRKVAPTTASAAKAAFNRFASDVGSLSPYTGA